MRGSTVILNMILLHLIFMGIITTIKMKTGSTVYIFICMYNSVFSKKKNMSKYCISSIFLIVLHCSSNLIG